MNYRLGEEDGSDRMVMGGDEEKAEKYVQQIKNWAEKHGNENLPQNFLIRLLFISFRLLASIYQVREFSKTIEDQKDKKVATVASASNM